MEHQDSQPPATTEPTALNQKRAQTAIDTYKNMCKKLDFPPLEPELERSAHSFLSSFIAVDQKRPDVRESREYAMMMYQLLQFIFSREQRLADINSKLVQDAIRIKEALLPFGTPKLSICIDVRVNPKLHSGVHGNAFQTAAGDNAHEFVQVEHSEELVLRDGEFSRMIRRAFKNADDLFEALDSHRHCAARQKQVESMGIYAPDGGLMNDVLRKKRMTTAIERHVRETYRGRKRVTCIQTSFDTHTGYLYTGLENCLPDDLQAEEDRSPLEQEIVRDGFTESVLNQLAESGRIVSTRHLAENPNDQTLKQLFMEHYFSINYPQDYQSSTINFWTAIQAMSQSALPVIREKLISVFPHLADKECEKELQQRALLLLANAFSGFLHNTAPNGSSKPYPFDEHDESVIVISYTDKGPYDRARPFNLDPQIPNLLGEIGLAQELVRTNRNEGRMSDLERESRDIFYGAKGESGKEYNKCPILVFSFSRLKRIPDPHVLSVLRSLDWSDFQSINWMDMNNEDFLNYLDEKFSNIPSYVANGINELRHHAITLHQREGDSTTELFIHGNLAPVCVLAGPNRETLTIIPFLSNGYKQRRKRIAR